MVYLINTQPVLVCSSLGCIKFWFDFNGIISIESAAVFTIHLYLDAKFGNAWMAGFCFMVTAVMILLLDSLEGNLDWFGSSSFRLI